MSQEQTVGFADQTGQWKYSIDNRFDDVHHSTDSNDADLNNFFSRPIKIRTINWAVNGQVTDTFDPWTLFFTNKRIINRISNYNLLRARLCVRLMINGNGFHYGRVLASYRPFTQEDDIVGWRIGLVGQDVIAASQRMHVWLDPTKSQGGTLCLPYVFPANAMSIPLQQWGNMGALDIGSVVDLKHANGGTDNVTISVFAWAEDVSLSMPTIAEPGAIAPQSVLEEHANEADAASSGPISGPAAAVAKVSGALSAVPLIGRMARATEMAASTTQSIARLFGMSRPVDTGPIQSYRPTYVGNMANTNVIDTSNKLTYDVKQELTIDPVAVGLGPDDEMAISSIASRESYLTQFSWPTTATPETLLWNSYVTPMQFDTASVGALEYHLTPMAYTAMPFRSWRGTIKYRFQVVASAFHKGRLKVVYDPYYNVAGESEYNTQYTHIIDLAKERDFTVDVSWGQLWSYLDVSDPRSTTTHSTTALGSSGSGFMNGVIGIYVVNELTTPSLALDDVSIMVSVSAGPDFEVVDPTQNRISTASLYLPPQSAGSVAKSLGVIMPVFFAAANGHSVMLNTSRSKSMSYKSAHNGTAFNESFSRSRSKSRSCGRILEEHSAQADADDTINESAPIAEDQHTRLGDIDCDPKSSVQSIYFGDPVTSLRQLFKRYQHANSWATTETSGTQYFTLPNFPFYRGYANFALTNSAAPLDPTPYSYAEMTLLNWFTPCFYARRGGIRHKYVYTSTTQPNGLMSVIRLARGTSGIAILTEQDTSSISPSNAMAYGSNRALDGHEGMVSTPLQQNPVLEVELPFFTRWRFSPARNLDLYNATWEHTHAVTAPTSGVAGDAVIIDYVAAAEDFSLTFFQACPVFYYVANPVPSATV